MSDDFDAYYQWLGIAPRDQPPNHYRLLGVDLFESSPDVIETAADRQMIHIRTFQSGPNGDASQKLLNEITTAKLCLLNAAKKAEYDAKLRADQEAATRPQARALRGGSSAPLTQMPEGVADFGPPMPRPPPGAFDVRSADSSVLSDGLSLRRSTAGTKLAHRMTTGQQAAIAGVVMGLIVILSVVVLLSRGGGSTAKFSKGDSKETAKAKAAPTFPQPKTADPPIAPSPSKAWSHVDLGTATVTGEYVRIAETFITTMQEYSGPIEIAVVARTNSTNIRLDAYRGACVIFNWEVRPEELRVVRPDGNVMLESGSIVSATVKPLKPNTWYRLMWRITADGMDVFVNDERVFSERAHYDLSAEGRVSVRSVQSVVDIKELRVSSLSKQK